MAQFITPFLWFKDQAEEAANFYVSIFPNSTVTNVQRFGEVGPGNAGTVLSAEFELNGFPYVALNGNEQSTFTEATSFQIEASDQDEIDHFWDSLTADGGEESMCGWLKDKFGVSWQVTPAVLGKLLGDPDPERAGRAMQAMLGMRKLVIADLEKAANGE